MKIEETLNDREKTYGDFGDYCRILADLKIAMEASKHRLNCIHSGALDMILSKIARILNGDPDHIDSWHDIAGYATLVEKGIRNGSSNA